MCIRCASGGHRLGVGIQRIVTAASRATLTASDGAILTGAATTVMLAMTAIEAASAHGRRRSSSLAILSLAVAMLVVGSMINGLESPVLMVVTIAAVCAAQVAVAVFEPPARRASYAAWRPLEKRSAG